MLKGSIGYAYAFFHALLRILSKGGVNHGKESVFEQEERSFLKRYKTKPYHRFREILVYCAILPKLTND